MNRMNSKRRLLWNERDPEPTLTMLSDGDLRRFSLLLGIWLFFCGTQACTVQSGRRDTIPPPSAVLLPAPPQPEPAPRDQHQTMQIGEASWYGPRFHGKLTSSGEVYNQYAFTAAHPTLPEGSRVKVTNLDNGKSVTVRVTDRGPFADGRIIDVSHRAAKSLGMVEEGTAKVRVKVLSRPKRSKNRARQNSQQK
jgi:Lytic transglycolase